MVDVWQQKVHLLHVSWLLADGGEVLRHLARYLPCQPEKVLVLTVEPLVEMNKGAFLNLLSDVIFLCLPAFPVA